MRPIKLTIKHFGPFAGTEVVDFEKFQNEGLFLINGQTGSGKTSILDAMTFAIYGEVLGLRGKPVNNKDAAVRLKSDYADPDVVPEVILEVDINGTHHRFTRSPKFRKSGNKSDTQPRATLEVLNGSQWEALATSTAEVGDLATQRLGLSKDQFAQLILLPQGGFAAFLNAKNEDKGKLLDELFPATTYITIRDWIKDQRSEAQAKIAQLGHAQSELEARLRQVTGNENLAISSEVLTETLTATSAEKSRCETLLETKTRDLEPLQLKLNNAEASQTAANAIAGANLDIQNANDELQSIKDVLEQFGITQPTESLLAEALAKSDLTASAAQSDLDKFKNLESLEHRLAEQNADLAALQQARTSATDDLEKHEASAVLLKTAIEANPKLDVEKLRCEQQVKDITSHKDLLVDLAALNADLKGKQQAQTDAEQVYDDALTKSISVKEIYNQDLAAYLAGDLKPNEECSVCGSKEHPNPANPKEGAPSKSDVDKASSNADAAKTKLDSTRIDFQAHTAKIETQRKQLPDDSSLDVVEQMLTDAQTALTDVNDRIQTQNIQQLELDQTNEQVKATIDLIAAGTSELAAAQSAVDLTKGGIEEAKKALIDKSQSDLEDILANALTKSEELRLMSPKFAQHNSAIVNAQAVIAANAEAAKNIIDNLDELRLKVTEDQHILNELRADHTRLSDQLDGINEIQEKFATLMANNLQAQQSEEQWANLESYTSGTVGRKIDLATFYLGYRLKQVLAAANHRLKAMTDGRYTLIHDESVAAAHGAKGGLAIMVIDSNSGQRRGPESLSGGETFMASLSLALGLSDIVSAEAGGRRLEALFVDEGFGSLDSETLDQVMDSLDELRATGRMVGLVSHVESMRSRVPAQIVVTKTNTGSTIQLVGV